MGCGSAIKWSPTEGIWPALSLLGDTEGGHAAGANLKQSARAIALEMTYFTRKLMDPVDAPVTPIAK